MQSATIKFKHFDKYRFIKEFTATVSDKSKKAEKEREAEIIANAIEENEQILFENLATKNDLELAKQILKNDLELAKQELKKDIIESKTDIIKWVIGLLMLQTGLLFTLVKFLSH